MNSSSLSPGDRPAGGRAQRSSPARETFRFQRRRPHPRMPSSVVMPGANMDLASMFARDGTLCVRPRPKPRRATLPGGGFRGVASPPIDAGVRALNEVWPSLPAALGRRLSQWPTRRPPTKSERPLMDFSTGRIEPASRARPRRPSARALPGNDRAGKQLSLNTHGMPVLRAEFHLRSRQAAAARKRAAANWSAVAASRAAPRYDSTSPARSHVAKQHPAPPPQTNLLAWAGSLALATAGLLTL